MSAWSRRDVLKGIGTPAIAASLPLRLAEGAPPFSRMPGEGPGTPKICLGFYGTADEAGMRRVKQIGVDHVLTGGPKIPWTEADLRARIEPLQGRRPDTLQHDDLGGFNDVIWGAAGSGGADRERRSRRSARPGRWACPSSSTTSTRTA